MSTIRRRHHWYQSNVRRRLLQFRHIGSTVGLPKCRLCVQHLEWRRDGLDESDLSGHEQPQERYGRFHGRRRYRPEVRTGRSLPCGGYAQPQRSVWRSYNLRQYNQELHRPFSSCGIPAPLGIFAQRNCGAPGTAWFFDDLADLGNRTIGLHAQFARWKNQGERRNRRRRDERRRQCIRFRHKPCDSGHQWLFTTPADAPSGLVFYPVTPCRVMDTRNPTGPLGGPILAAGSTRTVPMLSSTCGLPGTAAAYSLNMTVVPTGDRFPDDVACGNAQPLVSTLNDPTGTIVANAAIVPAGTGGSINVFVTDQTHLIIDVNGYFARRQRWSVVLCRDAMSCGRYAECCRTIRRTCIIRTARLQRPGWTVWRGGNDTSVLVQLNRCAAGIARFPHIVACGKSTADCLDAELAGREHRLERCHRTDEQRCH